MIRTNGLGIYAICISVLLLSSCKKSQSQCENSHFEIDVKNEIFFKRNNESLIYLGFNIINDSTISSIIRIGFDTDNESVTVDFPLNEYNSKFIIYSIPKIDSSYLLDFDPKLGIDHYKTVIESSSEAKHFRKILDENEIFNLPDESELLPKIPSVGDFTFLEFKNDCKYKFIAYQGVDEKTSRSEKLRLQKVVLFLKQLINTSSLLKK